MTSRPFLRLTICFVISLVACTAPASSPTTGATPTTSASAATSPTTSATPSPAPTSPAPTSTAPSATASAFPAPTNIRLAGRLPDLTQPVPPGEGEAGRLTISWESVAGPRGFRVYTRDCDGTVKAALDVPAGDRQYGPIHACRPTGNLGVSALYAGGESAIAWAR